MVAVSSCIAAGQDTCIVPTALNRELKAKYGEMRILHSIDLGAEDRKMFEKEHGTSCPGMARLDFYGEGKAAWALVLISDGSSPQTQLVLAREHGARFEVSPLDTAKQRSAVVWSEPPGEYRDIETGKTLQAVHPVIVFVSYESWAIVYGWTGSKVAKLWVMD
jgi:hypothetical protein